MNVNWSERQKAVIHNRNKNMLVSAAAGSGKTAVLVERIISMITDKDRPTDLDRLLVVTFTNAAAREMKERIRTRLSELIAQNDDERLRSQSVLIHNAKISTIHSFCSYVIKNYFYTIDADPAFRVMDAGEQKLMMSDCAREVLREAFERGDPGVLNFAAAFSTGKDSRNIQRLIIESYNSIWAEPWPYVWIENAKRPWNADSVEEIEASGEIKTAYETAVKELGELYETAEKNLAAALSPTGPQSYIPALEGDIRILKNLLSASDFDSLSAALKEAEFIRLPGGKKADCDPALKERLKTSHGEIRDAVKKLSEGYFAAPLREVLEENRLCRAHINAFCDLIAAFDALYSEKKRSQNLMDYGDLEHFALKILLNRDETGKVERTAAAKEIAASLDCVMTDEYQDSNDIQELILSAVSGNDDGRMNRFMVGDIKQSIYGFRNARPEIFLNKYDEYKRNCDTCEVVDLHDNYRSGTRVIETVNCLFEKIMSPEMGGVDYNDTHALHAGEKSDISDAEKTGLKSELLLLDTSEMVDVSDSNDAASAEGCMIASEIKKLRRSQDGKGFKYSDIAVIVRTVSQAEMISKALTKAGVPSHTDSRSGYFTTVEVSTVLNYIAILDNPLQDIPAAAVLFSPIGGLNTEELAKIRLHAPTAKFFRAALDYAKSGEDTAPVHKLNDFFDVYNELYEKSRYMGVSRLISEIYDRTSYKSYAAAMPLGAQRTANLDMLLTRAAAYEKTSYSGLFNFIRYIEELKKDEEDLGEANLFSDAGDAVRVMTIHKSKGQEFPVVFVSGCAKKFNEMSARGSVLINRDMGIGIDVIDFEGGRKKQTLYKRLVAKRIEAANKSEEVRVLYVALTRAKQKLYITAACGDVEKRIENAIDERNDGAVSYSKLLKADSFLDLILPAFANQEMFRPLTIGTQRQGVRFKDAGDFMTSAVVSAAELDFSRELSKSTLKENLNLLPKTGDGRVYDNKIHKLLSEINAFEYPYSGAADIPVKVSVSEIKRLHLVTNDEQAGVESLKEEIFPYIPKFVKEVGEDERDSGIITGAARGTAYHKLWRYFDYAALEAAPPLGEYEAIEKTARRLCDKNLLTKEELNSINIGDFVNFIASDIGVRMRSAAADGRLIREQPFTALIEAARVNAAWAGRDDIVVQGVIDAYFEEDGGLVLVDYKTDYTADKTGAELIKKYKTQLDIYADVLERSSGMAVKEKIIYSTCLGKAFMPHPI